MCVIDDLQMEMKAQPREMKGMEATKRLIARVEQAWPGQKLWT